MVREATYNDLDRLMRLYTFLHDNKMPDSESELALQRLWQIIMSDENHHIIVAEEDGLIVSSCVCIIVPNLTHSQRPYALVENVVTASEYRERGLASACLEYAHSVAERENCYKIMLMTGSVLDSTLSFYEHNGYNKNDKTAFIRWL